MAGRQITIQFLGDASKLKKSLGDVESKTSTLGSKLSKVGKVAAVGLGAGAIVAGKALADMTKGAVEDEAAATRLANTLQKAGGATKSQVAATEDWISAQGKAYGIADDDLRPALGRLVTATHDVGKAQKLASLAMDVSVGSGKSLESVSTALMKAQNGQVSALSRLGINTKDAEGKTLSMHEAVKRMSDTFGGAAQKNAETTAGKMQRLKVMMAETGEAIGYKLIPVATAMADFFLNKGIPALSQFAGWFQRNLIPALIVVGQRLAATSKFLYQHKNALIATGVAVAALTALVEVHAAVMAVAAAGGLLKWIKATKVVTAVTKAWAAVQWVMNAALAANPIVLVVAALAALGVALVIAYKKSETFRKVVTGGFEAVKKVVSAVMGFITKTIPAVFGRLPGQAASAMSSLRSRVVGVFQAAWGAARGAVSNGIGRVMDLIRSLPGKIRDVGGSMLSAGKDLIGKLFAGVLSAARNAGGFVGSLVQSIKSAINSALHLPLAINFDKGPLHIHATVIPAFAKGTMSAPGGLSLVGENGPELVNLPRGSRVRTAGDTARLMSGGGVTININGALDPVAVGRQVEQMLVKYQRSTGRKLQITTRR